jgi:hypothetical protein
MAEPDPISRSEAEPYFEKIRSTEMLRGDGIESEHCRRILEVLFELWAADPDAKVGQKYLAEKLGLSLNENHEVASANSVRLAAQKLRDHILPSHDRAYPDDAIRFEIPKSKRKSPYHLRVYRLAIPSEPHPRSEDRDLVPLVFQNRHNTREWYQDAVCGPSTDVLWISTASRHSLDEVVQWFKHKAVRTDRFRVLTWRPRSDAVVEAFCEHIDEMPGRVKDNCDSAWRTWKSIEAENDFVEVHGYTSVPTMQAICKADQSMKIELLPFNCNDLAHGFHQCGTREQRPALLLDAAIHPASFLFFKNALEDMWIDAVRREREADRGQPTAATTS